MNRCPICADISCRSRAEPNGAIAYDCPRCGVFTLSAALAGSLPSLIDRGMINRSALSHHVRGLPRGDDKPLEIQGQDIEAWRSLRPLTPREQQENLILWLGANQATPGQFLQSRKKPLSAIAGCHVTSPGQTEPELDWLVNQMKPLGVFESHFSNQPSVVALRLTLKGWDFYAELQRRGGRGRQAFMAMASDDRALTKVVNDCFRPVAARAGFELVSPNGAAPAGHGDEQLRGSIRAAPFILADLTHDDAGVLFAAGFAEGLGLPVIYTCEESRLEQREAHSETRRVTTIPWKIDNFDDAAQRLAAIIRANFPEAGRTVH